MALVADSFHMLSDVMSLIVAFLAVRMSRRKSTKNTFGWARAEILGAFFNAVFLLALCFSIFLEAIERIIHIANPMNGNKSHLKIEDPLLVLIVGCVGLGVNLIGLLLFHRKFLTVVFAPPPLLYTHTWTPVFLVELFCSVLS